MSGKVSEDELIGEMKSGRNLLFLVIGIGVVGIGVAIYFFMQ